MKRILLAASALALAAAPMLASAQPGDGRWGGRGGRNRGGEQTQSQTQTPSAPADDRGERGERRGPARQEPTPQVQSVDRDQGENHRRDSDGGARGTRQGYEGRQEAEGNRTSADRVSGERDLGSRYNGQAPRSVDRGRYNDDGSLRDSTRGRDGRFDGRGMEGRNPDGGYNRGDGRWDGNRDNRNGGWDRSRRGGSTFQWRGRSYQRHRVPAYRWAPGFSYQRWGVGSILPRLLFQNDYIVRDYWAYDLPPPPPGTYYLRVDMDLYIVAYRSGRVVDVIPDVFYYDDYGW